MNIRTLLALLLLTNLWFSSAWLYDAGDASQMNAAVESSMSLDHGCCDTGEGAGKECLSHCYQASSFSLSDQEIIVVTMAGKQKLRSSANSLIISPIYGLFRPPIA